MRSRRCNPGPSLTKEPSGRYEATVRFGWEGRLRRQGGARRPAYINVIASRIGPSKYLGATRRQKVGFLFLYEENNFTG